MKKLSARNILIGSIAGGVISALLSQVPSRNMKNKFIKRIIAKKIITMVSKFLQ